jgi:phosphoribosylformylglycinamidine synthase subunit PurQ / glutaminase
MGKPRVLVFSGYGLNCEEETKFAFDQAGGDAEIVHVNDLIAGLKKLSDYQIMAVPGGFSYGDDTGSGKAFANKLRNHLWADLEAFVRRDTLTIGICNGFQILSNLGLLPAIDSHYGERQAALVHNDSARYTVRWVDLRIDNDSPWLKGIKDLSVPIAHGEGKLMVEPEVLEHLLEKKLIALTYTRGEICEFQDLPVNPNGSTAEIAGITDESGRVLGLMPHPERALFFTQLPHWTTLKSQLDRSGRKLPESGPGAQLFQNAVRYFDGIK